MLPQRAGAQVAETRSLLSCPFPSPNPHPVPFQKPCPPACELSGHRRVPAVLEAQQWKALPISPTASCFCFRLPSGPPEVTRGVGLWSLKLLIFSWRLTASPTLGFGRDERYSLPSLTAQEPSPCTALPETADAGEDLAPPPTIRGTLGQLLNPLGLGDMAAAPPLTVSFH